MESLANCELQSSKRAISHLTEHQRRLRSNPTDEPFTVEKLPFIVYDLVGVDQNLAGFKAVAYENLGQKGQQIDAEDDHAKEWNMKGFEAVKSVFDRLVSQL